MTASPLRTVPARSLQPGDVLANGLMVIEVYNDDPYGIWIKFSNQDEGSVSSGRRFRIYQ
ncbi:hypothetical protein GBF35_16495 [Nonomuraea phyllanthi]|uniref:hypothetical protein n=1 Tax=Nonomuraea phyllanthi TaxID=2219224 RepID=UPI0012938556|nr:hypothetical protein [Nonomuraea phyllanthi]QFY08065.1 hypothetical protein GBF35_16495 [Nonomuraea phyllanthi]